MTKGAASDAYAHIADALRAKGYTDWRLHVVRGEGGLEPGGEPGMAEPEGLAATGLATTDAHVWHLHLATPADSKVWVASWRIGHPVELSEAEPEAIARGPAMALDDWRIDSHEAVKVMGRGPYGRDLELSRYAGEDCQPDVPYWNLSVRGPTLQLNARTGAPDVPCAPSHEARIPVLGR